jgi:hypothetical protein
VARYADTLLADGERIALRTRQHWLATIVDGRGPWLLFIVSLLLIAIRVFALKGDGALEFIVGWGGLACLVVALVLLGRVYWSWYAQDYIVTNRRILKVEGIINKTSADSSLEKINDAVLQQNLFGRLFGWGDLDILTAADTAIDRYRMLRGAPSFKKTMLDQKHALEMEVVRMPSPALRAGGARSMTADEVTKALNDLADLRDRGALSPADYETKKQELLGRL